MFSKNSFSKRLSILSISVSTLLLQSCSTKYERLEQQLIQVNLENYKSSNDFFLNPTDSVRALQEYLQLANLTPQNTEHAKKVLRMLQFAFNEKNSIETNTVLAQLLDADAEDYFDELKPLVKSPEFPRIALQIATLSDDADLRKALSLNLNDQHLVELFLKSQESDAVTLAIAGVLLDKNEWIVHTAALIKEIQDSEAALKKLSDLSKTLTGKARRDIQKTLVFAARSVNKTALLEASLKDLRSEAGSSEENEAILEELDSVFSRDGLLVDRFAGKFSKSTHDLLQKTLLSAENSTLVFKQSFVDGLLIKGDYRKAASYLILHKKVAEGIKLLKDNSLEFESQKASQTIYDVQASEETLKFLASKDGVRLHEKIALLSFQKKHHLEVDFSAELRELSKQYLTADEQLTLLAVAIDFDEMEVAHELKGTLRAMPLNDRQFFGLTKIFYKSDYAARAAQIFYASLGRNFAKWSENCHLIFMTNEPGFFLNYASKALILNNNISENKSLLLSQLAHYAFEKNWLDAAAHLLNKIPAKDRKLSDFLAEGDVHYKNGDYKVAAASYINTSKFNPEINLPYLLATQAFTGAGDLDKAKKARKLAAIVNLGKYSFHSFSLRYLKDNKHEAILEEYSQLIAPLLIPGSPFHGLTLSIVTDYYDHRGEAVLAYDSYRKFVYLQMMSPGFFDSPSSVLRASAKLKELQLKAAIKQNADAKTLQKLTQEALAYSGDNIEISIALSQSKQKDLFKQTYTKQWQDAVALLKKYPKSDFLLNFTAWLAASTSQNLDEAELYSKKSIRLSENAAYYDTLAEVYFKQNKLSLAIENMEKAVEISENLPIFIHRLNKLKEQKVKDEASK